MDDYYLFLNVTGSAEVKITTQAPYAFSTIKQRKWDSSRSMRWNQDAQREEGLCLYL